MRATSACLIRRPARGGGRFYVCPTSSNRRNGADRDSGRLSREPPLPTRRFKTLTKRLQNAVAKGPGACPRASRRSLARDRTRRPPRRGASTANPAARKRAGSPACLRARASANLRLRGRVRSTSARLRLKSSCRPNRLAALERQVEPVKPDESSLELIGVKVAASLEQLRRRSGSSSGPLRRLAWRRDSFGGA